ncbi:condensation domain-containing protein [Aureimonas pseudogalii]|uniref:Condensation domain-containing protein n=1 Tax=Aureimonas pseudogalii TaxID=1744844 RepID=A0A7W6EAZ0_9HYPH|nr:condensation domain-containing protein [Aureimonas pseudogalii]MBB3996731.1 hypothetical protein [Aureimonas pseudogalii]
MTAGSLPTAWSDLPRELRDAVLARLLARRLRDGAGADEPALMPTDRNAPVPVSLEQAFILRQQTRYGGRVAWTIAAPPIVFDDVDVDAVRRAVAALARRHDVLHMTIREENGRLVQRLDPDAPAPLELTTLPLMAAVTGAEGWVRRRYETMLAQPFDAVTGPLWRAELISRGGRGVLLLCFCSLVADGETLHLIDAELRALYAAERGGAASEPPRPALDYADYAAAQDRLLRGARFGSALAWWHERLAGGPPGAWADGREGIGPARLYEQEIGAGTGRALDAFAAARRTTPHVVLLAEFAAFLRELDGTDDVWVASATTSRHLAGTQSMIGTFARLLPLRLREPAAGDALDGVGATLLEALDQEPVPHVLLQEMLEAAHPAAASPFRYIFNHRQVGEKSDKGGEGDVSFRHGPRHAEAHREEHVLLMVLQSGERRELHWYLRTDRFGPADAQRLLTGFLAALRRRIGMPPAAAGEAG